LDLLPDGVKKVKINETSNENEKTGMFSKFSEVLKNLPNTINSLIGKNAKQDNTGEQKNLGEQILRVSFHPEGIKILRMLLDPIYKSLNSLTENMDKGLMDIIKNMKSIFGGTGMGGLTALLLLALADIIWMSEKIVKIYKGIKNFIIGIGEIFTKLGRQLEEVGMAFKRFLIDPFIKIGEKLGINKWIEETIVAIGNSFKNLKTNIISKFSEIKAGIIEKLNLEGPLARISEIKNKFVESLKPVENLFAKMSNGIKDAWKYLTELKDGFMGWIQKISNMFKGEGAFSSITKTFNSIVEAATKVKGPIQTFFEAISPLGRMLGFLIVPLKWLLKFISIPVIQVIDGIVTGIKTFFSVMNDDALGPIQKATAVFAGFFGGLGSLISEFISFFGTILQMVGKIPLLGWVGKIGEWVSAGAEAIDTHKLGQDTIDLMHTYNEGAEAPKNDERLYRNGDRYKNASPEEKKKIDERYDNMGSGKKITEENKPTPAPSIIAEPAPTPSPQKYEPKPDENSNKMSAQNVAFDENNKKIVNSLNNLTETLRKNSEEQNKPQNTTIINQAQQPSKPDSGIKDYLLGPTRDVNYEARMSYTSNSNNRNWSYI
jgi:hypothetical protein